MALRFACVEPTLFRILRLVRVRIVPYASLPPPASSIATRHSRASWWIPRLRDPCAGCIVRTFAAGCFGANSGGAVRMPDNRQRETARIGRIARVSAQRFERKVQECVFADAETKSPRMAIRGRSRASEIGATDLRKRISRGVCRCRAACADCRDLSTARMRPHRDGSATFRTGWRCGRRVSSEDSAGIGWNL